MFLCYVLCVIGYGVCKKLQIGGTSLWRVCINRADPVKFSNETHPLSLMERPKYVALSCPAVVQIKGAPLSDLHTILRGGGGGLWGDY